MQRRDFIKKTAALAIGSGIYSGLDHRAQSKQVAPRKDMLIMDAMGEIRLTHERSLLEQIIASGTNSVTVTLCDPKQHEQKAYDSALESILAYDRHIRKNQDLLIKATTSADIHRAKTTKRLALFYYFQNTTQFGRDLNRIDLFYQLGVRSCQLTYNHQNWVGTGCKERFAGGLSRFGIELVEKMNNTGMLIDISHASERTMADTIQASKKPIIISHTGCMTVYQNIRNTQDDSIRKLADKGGVIGICQIRPFITSQKRGNLQHYFKHVRHAIRVAGIDHVCIGSDRDHRIIQDTPEEMNLLHQEEGPNFVNDDWPLYMSSLNGPRRMEVVRDGLQKMGLSYTDIEKVMGLNLLRIYKDVIG